MNAIRLHGPSDPAQLVYEQVETPRPAAGEALVRVHAAAITRDELTWPVDRLPAIPCYEVSGVIAELGPGVAGLEIGQPIYALSPFDHDGAAAEMVAIPVRLLAPKPATLSHVESAAIPLPALSAWQALFDHGRLAPGQRVLVHGAAGAVGSCAVQIAHYYGATVIGTASAENLEFVRGLGADQVIDDSVTPFDTVTEPVDLIVDTAGGDRLARSPAVIRAGGRLVGIAVQPALAAAAARGITAVYFVVSPNREQLVELARLADGGHLRPVIDQVFPLAQARQAFERSLGHHPPGKIVLRVVP